MLTALITPLICFCISRGNGVTGLWFWRHLCTGAFLDPGEICLPESSLCLPGILIRVEEEQLLPFPLKAKEIYFKCCFILTSKAWLPNHPWGTKMDSS